MKVTPRFPTLAFRHVTRTICLPRWPILSALPMFCLLSLVAVQAADDGSEAMRQRILTGARMVSADDYAFTRTARTQETEGGKTEKHVTIERYDPARPADQRWTLVSMDGRTPTADELSKHRKGLAGRRVANYGRVADYFAAPAAAAADAEGRKVMKFEKLAKGSLLVNDADISANATGEATINDSGEAPFVEQMRFTSTKSTRVKLVAVIERMESTTRYRMMPNGKPAPVEQITDMTGSMMGKQGRIRTVLTYSDHAPRVKWGRLLSRWQARRGPGEDRRGN